MSFTKTKDRVWVAYEIFASWLARRSMPVRRMGYGIFGAVLWLAYLPPNGKVRLTFNALASHVDHPQPRRLFGRWVSKFLLGMNRIEQVRHGFTDAIDPLLRIDGEQRLQSLLAESGGVLVVPHTQASFAMGRGLAQRYELLTLARSAENERRSAAEQQIYDTLGCDVLDVRTANPAIVARKVLGALRDKKLVIATVDRIRPAPPTEEPIQAAADLVRANAFGQPIGIAGWPARFAWKAKAPIIPATVVQDENTITLKLGPTVTASDDLVATTQAWVTELEALMRAHPDEWTFALDKHWSRVLRAPTAD